jgi:hypothetical protein
LVSFTPSIEGHCADVLEELLDSFIKGKEEVTTSTHDAATL